MAESWKIELGGLLMSWNWGPLIGWFVMDAAKRNRNFYNF